MNQTVKKLSVKNLNPQINLETCKTVRYIAPLNSSKQRCKS